MCTRGAVVARSHEVAPGTSVQQFGLGMVPREVRMEPPVGGKDTHAV